MVRIEKGKFLQIGLEGRKGETKREVISLCLTYTSLALLSFFFAYLAYTGRSSIAGSNALDLIVSTLMGIGITLVIFFMNGAEIDAVYQNGLTHHRVGLIKKLQGKHWIPWGEIDKIEYGYIDDAFKGELDISEYIRIYADDKATWYFTQNSFGRHNPKFYPLLLKMLHERSLQGEWIRKNVTDYEEYESRDLPIPSPSCPTCGAPLTYIPDDARWYCYECGEYEPEE